MAGKSPLELLTPDPNRIPSFFEDKFNPLIASVFAFGAVCYFNWAKRRPIFSGIQKHGLALAGGFAVGYYIDQKRNAYLAERDAILRHYIELHPEDFPAPERKKFSEIFKPWTPVR